MSYYRQLYLLLDIPPTHIWHIDHCRMVYGAWLRSVSNRRWPAAEHYICLLVPLEEERQLFRNLRAEDREANALRLLQQKPLLRRC